LLQVALNTITLTLTPKTPKLTPKKSTSFVDSLNVYITYVFPLCVIVPIYNIDIAYY
jgi:hypothetical protein